MAIKCSAGNCGISCDADACTCTSSWDDPDNCSCECLQTLPANKPIGEKKSLFLRYKGRIKANPQYRLNFCAHNAPITTLAQSFDEVLPNRILVPANKLTKSVLV
jgi:hypothetical protein